MPKPEMQSTTIPVACFAPPITDELLEKYRTLVRDYTASVVGGEQIKDALETCLKCVEKWWSLPASNDPDTQKWSVLHRGKPTTFKVTPLTKELVKDLWEATPWMSELGLLSNPEGTGLFDGLKGPIRDCAFHLLWHCKELTLDREPLTSDVLPS